MVTKVKETVDVVKELEKVDQQMKAFDSNIRSMNLDTLNLAPVQENEPQTKLSSGEIEKKKDIYLKPARAIGSKEKFNEDYRKEWEFAKEYTQFIAENNMIVGESIELWTKPFAGVPAEFWKVPVNTPVYGPRHLAEQINRAKHHALEYKDTVLGSNGYGQDFGKITATKTVQRLEARPVISNKSIFV